MKFKIAFAISKTERKLRLRFWKWEILCFDDAGNVTDENIIKDPSKTGALSFDEKEGASDFEKFLFQALFYPNVERRIWRMCKKLFNRTIKLFTVNFENTEIKGSLEDPFYDAVAMGISGGCYYPNWEEEKEGWSIKGEVVFKTGFFRFIFFVQGIVYEAAILIFILWRGVRLAKKFPDGENMEGIRRWIFLRLRS